ncbi:E3 SUMO-protein ligase ZBED1-like [Melanotaenia boesemani]|uniref:E3 SUMO-protein ligase ZBED1-like n=1 Tax=Melanotaenia boesemani TaxID=1250792 RepID=UPI001C040071|nr:E3 SUMO-protein ligase ZBED1-like [Melanotaenia boesemani]
MLHTLELRYVIPSRKYFSETAVPQMYKDIKEKVKEKLIRAERVALTCDAWTSRATQSYITITAHHITEDWSLSSHVLQTRDMHECHTGSNLAELLCNVVTEWYITDKDPALVSDNAANMVVAAQLAGFLHVKCYAHTLNLASQRALKLPAVASLLGRVPCVTGFFHRSAIALNVLEQKQKLLELPAHKLITDISTRWNSAYDMVERFLEQQPAVTAALLSPDVRKKEKDISTFTESDISNAEEFIRALKPVKVATSVMSDENNPTVSVIAPLHAQLLQATQETLGDPPFVRDLKEAVHQDLSKRYTSEVEKATLNLASALDPRFKVLPFLTEEEKQETFARMAAEAATTVEHCQEVVRQNQEELGDYAAATEEGQSKGEDGDFQGPPSAKRRVSCALDELLGNTFGETSRQVSALPEKSAFDSAAEEVKDYNRAAPLPLSESPLEWWKEHHYEYPFLAKLAKRYLCVPGTSVSAERVFSTARDIVTAQRSSLTTDHVDQLLFLHKNLDIPKHYEG